MGNDRADVHQTFHGARHVLQIGEATGSTITIVEAGGQRRVIPFLAPAEAPKCLVGRDESMHRVRQMLSKGPGVPTCTISGGAGVGKTALATGLAYNLEMLSRFSDGVLWAGVGTNPDLLALLGQWARAVGVPQDLITAEDAVEGRAKLVHRHIGGRKFLLVADDLWTVEQARVFQQIGGPGCARLFTTRDRQIEATLGINDVERLQDLTLEHAVELLTHYARGVTETDETRQMAVELVQALGCLPLGVTLIGKYLALPSLTGGARMMGALKALRDSLQRPAPARSATGRRPSDADHVPRELYAAIRTSDEKLEAAASAALRCLTVFPPKPNSFSHDAAVEVCRVTDPPADPIYALFDRGLLEHDGPGRYSIHPAIRAYAQDDNEPAARRARSKAPARMAEHYIEHVGSRSGRSAELLPDNANILAALEHAGEREMRTTLVRCVNAFFDFLEAQGLYAGNNVRRYLTRAGAYAESLTDPSLQAATFLVLARLEEKEGNLSDSVRLRRRAATLLVRAKAKAARLRSELWLVAGLQRMTRTRYSSANRALNRSLRFALMDKRCDHRHLITIHRRLGQVALSQHRFDAAEEVLRRGLSLADEHGDVEQTVGLLVPMGWVAFNREDMGAAAGCAERGLRLLEEHKINHCEYGVALRHLAAAATHNRGDMDAARRHVAEGLSGARQIKHKWYLSALYCETGEICLRTGQLEDADGAFRDAVDVAPKDSADRAAFAVFGQARVAAARGPQGSAAARELGQRSHDLFASINHGHARLVREWLEHLTSGMEEARQPAAGSYATPPAALQDAALAASADSVREQLLALSRMHLSMQAPQLAAEALDQLAKAGGEPAKLAHEFFKLAQAALALKQDQLAKELSERAVRLYHESARPAEVFQIEAWQQRVLTLEPSQIGSELVTTDMLPPSGTEAPVKQAAVQRPTPTH